MNCCLTLVVTSLENPITTITRTSTKMDEDDKEQLYIGTAESEHIEMYLKAIWHLRERGKEVKISSIAKLLNVRQPSVVQMLGKLNDANLVDYEKGNLVKLESTR